MLERKAPVDGDEGVKALLSSTQKVTVGHPGPAGFWRRGHVVSRDLPGKASIDALVKKHPHDAFEISRAVA